MGGARSKHLGGAEFPPSTIVPVLVRVLAAARGGRRRVVVVAAALVVVVVVVVVVAGVVVVVVVVAVVVGSMNINMTMNTKLPDQKLAFRRMSSVPFAINLAKFPDWGIDGCGLAILGALGDITGFMGYGMGLGFRD